MGVGGFFSKGEVMPNQRNYQPAPPVVAQWIEREFRHRIMHDPVVMATAAAVLKVGVEAGEPSIEALRTAITAAVLEVAGVNPDGPATN